MWNIWDIWIEMLVEIVTMAICAQVFLALIGENGYTKYLRMFVGMLVLLEFCIALNQSVETFETAILSIWRGA